MRSPESGSSVCSQQMNPLQSTRSRREHPKRRLPGEVSPPAPVPSVCDHEPSQGLLRSSIVVSIFSGHCARPISQAGRSLFLKIAPAPCRRGFVFPATGNLGCLSGQRAGNFPGVFSRESKRDCQAAISLIYAGQWVTRCRDRDHLSQRDMPKGPRRCRSALE